MNRRKANHASTYHIRVQGVLKSPLAEWLGDIQVIPQEDGVSLLVGKFVDQPALRGFMDQLWNFNLVLLSVERIENQSEQNPLQTQQE